MGPRARSLLPLALFLLQVPGLAALRSGPSQEQAARNRRQQRERDAKTLGGGREVWIVDLPTRAPRASPDGVGEGTADQAPRVAVAPESAETKTPEQALLLQRSSGEHRRQPPAEPEPSTTVQAPGKFDDVEAQVSALEGFITLSGEVVANMQDTASTFNSSAAKGDANAAARSLQEVFAAAAGGMDFYKNSVGDLQGALFGACGGHLGVYMKRYGWMDGWKNTLSAMHAFFNNVSKTIAASADLAPELLPQQICPYLGTILPAVSNVSLAYIAQLSYVVSLGNGSRELENEPLKTGVRMVTAAMATVQVHGIFLADDGISEQVCRSSVFIANTKLGCKLQLPWAVHPEAQAMSKEDEEKLKKATKELEKMAKKGMPWMPAHHVRLLVIVLVVCAAMLVIGIWMCLHLPLELLAVPFFLAFHIVKVACMVVIGLLGIVWKIVSFPVVKCCCFRKTKEAALDGVKDSQNTGIPQDVLEKMPLDVRLVHQGTAAVKEVVGGPVEANAVKQPAEAAKDKPGAAGPPQEALPANNGVEHPMYRKFGLDPTSMLRRQYERKK